MTQKIKNFSEYYPLKTALLKLSIFVIFACAFLYLYYVNIMVSQIAAKEQNMKIIQSANQEYQILESQYLSDVGKFDLEYSQELGLVDSGNDVAYAARQNAFALLQNGRFR